MTERYWIVHDSVNGETTFDTEAEAVAHAEALFKARIKQSPSGSGWWVIVKTGDPDEPRHAGVECGHSRGELFAGEECEIDRANLRDEAHTDRQGDA